MWVLTLWVKVFFVGAHPVGDWLAMAVRMQLPIGGASTKQVILWFFFKTSSGRINSYKTRTNPNKPDACNKVS
jgi:hypothetical protein